MKWLRYLLLGIVAALLIAVGAVLFLVNDWTRGPLPTVNGEVQIAASSAQAGESTATSPGLSAEVEIIRDNWGIPHIYAETSYDLFFAQGYTQAQDRWWQMEFSRHIGGGRIQELTGQNDSVMGSDVFIRVSGWRAAAQRDLDAAVPEEVAVLQAFADGVNSYILNRDKSDLAMEYNLLGMTGVSITVEPWTPVDTLAWAKVMAWDLSGNRGLELTYSALINKLGEQTAQDWLPPYPYGQKPTILQSEDLPITADSAALTPAEAGHPALTTVLAGGLTPNSPLMLRHPEIGSNNWVVSGDLTTTGKPFLANDPHLSIQMPSIWYEVGLHCRVVNEACPYDVVGFALPASPGVIIGHNGRIAWGVTNVGPDTQDLYTLKINPENPLQYEWNGEWRDMTTREEIIRFGDSTQTVTLQVRQTHLGPVINDYAINEDGTLNQYNTQEPMAFRWTALQEPSTLLQAVMLLNQAQNWEDFREALQYWDSPSQNVIYADVDGNIGYQMPGNIPIRAAGHTGLLPVDGTTDTFEWKGYVPFDNLPRIFNPERGWIATANEAVVPLEYYDQLREALGGQFGEDSHYIFAYDWDYGYRAQRIEELLTTTGPQNAQTFAAIHGDNQSISAIEIQPYLSALDFGTADYNAQRDWLFTDWDYQFSMESQQAGLYAYFWRRLVENFLNDQAEDIFEGGGGNQLMWMVHQLLKQPENAWWDDTRTPDVTETRDDILTRSFREAVDQITADHGAERGGWRWGDIHTATFISNPLGLSGIDLIEQMVNRGPFPTAGGSAIVNATNWNFSEGGFEVSSLPSMRFIADLSDLSASQTIHTTGQSGHPFSLHYGDMIDLWRNIQYHPQLWTREQVEAVQTSRLVLLPAGG
jgi:penicillin amidase